MHLQPHPIQDSQETILHLAESYLRREVAPQAALLDCDSKALQQALKSLGDRSLLALTVPEIWGGAGFTERNFRRFQVMVTRYSGALAFLQSQHQSAAAMLAKSTNETLKQEFLPFMASGKVLMGVGYSHLRRGGDPVLKAIPTEGGYYLEGEIPWISGYGLLQNVLIGATAVDDQEVYGILPFSPQPNLEFSPPMELAAMSSTNTVSATVKGYFLSGDPAGPPPWGDRLVTINSPQSFANNDQNIVLNHSFFALGCTEAALDILERVFLRKKLQVIQDTYDFFQKELTNLSQEIFRAIEGEESFEAKLALRVKAINLASRCAFGAACASGGVGNERFNPASRVYREALVFSVSGQTSATMEGGLRLLLNSGL